MSKSRLSCRIKASLAVISVLAALTVYTLRQRMRHLSSANITKYDLAKNEAAALLDALGLRKRGYSRRTTFGNGSETADSISEPPDGLNVSTAARYVSMCSENFDQRRTGNQLFNFAAMLHVSRLTGRRVAMVRHHPHGWLDRWFRVRVTRVESIENELCPCVVFREEAALEYSRKLRRSGRLSVKTLLICGWFQSWKYAAGVESALGRHLRPLPEVQAAVRRYAARNLPSSAWRRKSVARVGIHVRAGDVMRCDKRAVGYTIPHRSYFERAMSRFVDHRSQLLPPRYPVFIQFVVASDNLTWVKSPAGLNFSSVSDRIARTPGVAVDVTYSEGHDAGFDLALLSLCDGLVISTGSFGWWAAWLANKTTIYYSNWPRPGSHLARQFKRDDYFPPTWIPLDGPEFPHCIV